MMTTNTHTHKYKYCIFNTVVDQFLKRSSRFTRTRGSYDYYLEPTYSGFFLVLYYSSDYIDDSDDDIDDDDYELYKDEKDSMTK